LNASKVLTTGSALTFDGTNLGVPAEVFRNTASGYVRFAGGASAASGGTALLFGPSHGSKPGWVELGTEGASSPIVFNINSTEQMRLTSTGLGIGTSSPGSYYAKNLVVGVADQGGITIASSPSAVETYLMFADGTSGADAYTGYIGYSHTSNFMRFATNGGGERMRLDSSGNLGLGVTPSAWNSAYKALDFTWASLASENANQGGMRLNVNAFADSSGYNNWYRKNNAAATSYKQNDGIHSWYTAAYGTAGSAISFTQAMTLDASGNLLLGGTSNSLGARFLSENASGNQIGLRYTGVATYYNSVDSSGNLVWTKDGTERARIDSSGNFRVGVSTSTPNLYMDVNHVTGSITGSSFFVARYNGTQIGDIAQNGTTGVSYNTSSDYRLKENIQPMTGALAKVAALKPCTYKWKADGSDGEGFIAHELQAVVPQCVTGEKDAVDADGNPVYQGIDTSFLVATLAAAIQELKAEFDAYKASHP
jgi:hypothetical protein